MKKFIIQTGWKLKPQIEPTIIYIDKESEKQQFIILKEGNNLSIESEANNPRFCIGYNKRKVGRVPCPTIEIIPHNRVQCQSCSSKEFFICRALCRGDFCNPSSEGAKEYCWNTNAYVYLTFVSGKLKVGSTTNPIRRWISQGSDASIIIGQGVGLDPRALEHQIGQNLTIAMAVRTSTKLKQLGRFIEKSKITEKINKGLDMIYESIKSPTLFPRDRLGEIRFLQSYYGNISKLQTRPQIKLLDPNDDFIISGKIVGVKGSLLVLKNNKTFFATNLNSFEGRYISLSDKIIEMKGQKSLFDFV